MPKGSTDESKRAWLPFVLSLIATPLCLFLAMASAGAGHGDYFWAKLIYPYTMLSTLLFNSITIPFSLLAILQVPIYGVLLSIAWARNRIALAGWGLLTLHVAAALACFAVRLEYFR